MSVTAFIGQMAVYKLMGLEAVMEGPLIRRTRLSRISWFGGDINAGAFALLSKEVEIGGDENRLDHLISRANV
jgi:hypothetical protein